MLINTTCFLSSKYPPPPPPPPHSTNRNTLPLANLSLPGSFSYIQSYRFIWFHKHLLHVRCHGSKCHGARALFHLLPFGLLGWHLGLSAQQKKKKKRKKNGVWGPMGGWGTRNLTHCNHINSHEHVPRIISRVIYRIPVNPYSLLI